MTREPLTGERRGGWRTVRGALALGAALAAVVTLGIAAHEGGHALVTLSCGGKIHQVGVMPGLQLYPQLQLEPWEGDVAYLVSTKLGAPWQHGLRMMMGGIATALASYLVLLFLVVRKPGGVARTALLAAAFLYSWDVISYSIFPALGLRHWIVCGGLFPEPLIGALMFGVGIPTFAFWLTLHFILSHCLLLHCWRQRKEVNSEQ